MKIKLLNYELIVEIKKMEEPIEPVVQQIKSWKPDTCGCHVGEIYEGTNIVGMGAVYSKCPAHANVPDEELYETIYGNVALGIYGENRMKNHVERTLLGYEGLKDLGVEETKTNTDGSEAGVGFKEGIKYKWHFEGEGKDRILKWELEGVELTQKQKDDIDIELGKKVDVSKLENLTPTPSIEVL